MIQECKEYKNVLSPLRRQFTVDMNTFLPIMIRYQNLTNCTYLTEYSSTYCLFHYINHVRGDNGSSVITVTRQFDINEGKGVFSCP